MNPSATLPATSKLTAAFHAAHGALSTAKAVFFTTHQRTDGDDLGTVLALFHAYQKGDKQSVVGIKGGVPKQLSFMPGSQHVLPILPARFIPDVVVVSGCSNLERTGLPETLLRSATIINIDHHADNENFGDINIVDQHSSSVAELAYHFFQAIKLPINADMAICLLTGIITDTGSFLHSNTAPSTLKAAGELMRKGARTALVAKHTSKGKNALILRAWSKALGNAWLDTEKKMICSVVTSEDLQELENPPLAVFEGFIETLNKVPEAAFALFLKQDGDIIKGSLRSDPNKHGGMDVGQLAKLFGGGGHKHAAGFVMPGKLKMVSPNQWTVETTLPQTDPEHQK